MRTGNDRSIQIPWYQQADSIKTEQMKNITRKDIKMSLSNSKVKT